MKKMPPLEPGSSYEIVLRNVVRLVKQGGLSMREATKIAVTEAGLSRFPRRPVPPPVTDPPPTIH
jgi:hypothetical protein